MARNRDLMWWTLGWMSSTARVIWQPSADTIRLRRTSVADTHIRRTGTAPDDDHLRRASVSDTTLRRL